MPHCGTNQIPNIDILFSHTTRFILNYVKSSMRDRIQVVESVGNYSQSKLSWCIVYFEDTLSSLLNSFLFLIHFQGHVDNHCAASPSFNSIEFYLCLDQVQAGLNGAPSVSMF